MAVRVHHLHPPRLGLPLSETHPHIPIRKLRLMLSP
jgi:hypothetical protein